MSVLLGLPQGLPNAVPLLDARHRREFSGLDN